MKVVPLGFKNPNLLNLSLLRSSNLLSERVCTPDANGLPYGRSFTLSKNKSHSTMFHFIFILWVTKHITLHCTSQFAYTNI